MFWAECLTNVDSAGCCRLPVGRCRRFGYIMSGTYFDLSLTLGVKNLVNTGLLLRFLRLQLQMYLVQKTNTMKVPLQQGVANTE